MTSELLPVRILCLLPPQGQVTRLQLCGFFQISRNLGFYVKSSEFRLFEYLSMVS